MITTQLDITEAYHLAATRAAARHYRALGYQVGEEEEVAPGLRPALVARRGSEVIFVEVKVRSATSAQPPVLARLQEVARQLSPPAQVRLLLASPPEEKAIELPGIEVSLLAWLQTHYAETELGPDAYPDRLEALDLQRVTVQQGQLQAEGRCDVAISYAATADFDPRDEPDAVSLRFTVRLNPATNYFLFDHVQLLG